MSCGGCGKSSCRGCKDIKVILPAGVGISSITDNGDGTWTITYTDNSTEIINTPGTVPNDAWVTILNNGAGITTPTGTADHTVYNDININVAYKILSSDTAVIKVRTELDVTISSTEGNDDIDHLIDFSFILDNIQIGGSNWFPLEEKMFQGLFPDYLGSNIGVPVVISHGGGDPLVNSAYHSSGRAGCSNSLVFCQDVSPKVVAGNYLFNVEFEMTVQLSTPL